MINVDEDNLKQGLLGLVIALVEVIKEVLEGQALRRMEGGSLTEEEVNRLGEALIDLDNAIESIKKEQNLEEAVQSIRDSLDEVVDSTLAKMINPERWEHEVKM